MNQEGSSKWRQAGLVLGALGVVFGDIGTSPLYALKECFASSTHAVDLSRENVLGILSLIFWSLILIVSIKYLVFVLRANHKGEGGILALLSLALPEGKSRPQLRAALLTLGMFGAALLYGDGMITPAISVLSAVEGLNVATPAFEHFVVPITVLVLIGMFSVQRFGTGKVGSVFGPITMLWFLAIGALGVSGILLKPEVLNSLNPLHGIQFLLHERWMGFVALGAVFLVVTGGEALYADMGHFGIKPIRSCWFGLVLPALMLNYLGQGALLLHDATAKANPFYLLAPGWALIPLVCLATVATVIASQALISGAFSLTMHALQLGYLPRMVIKQTSSDVRGQIYMPHVNWMLMLACAGLVLGFQSSSNLAAAYGIAVTLTMAITSVLFYFAAQRFLGWSAQFAAALCTVFLLVEMAFFGANFIKVAHGGWFPLLVALVLFVLMTTWRRGRELLRHKLQRSLLPLEDFLRSIRANPPTRVKGTAVFMAGNPNGTPIALLHNLKHNKVLHERTVLLTMVTLEVPRVSEDEQLKVEALGDGFFRITGHCGFMDEPDVPKLLRSCVDQNVKIKTPETTFFLSRETVYASSKPGMARWRAWIFSLMSRNAQPATDFFQLPPNRVVELGMQVEV